MFRLLFLGNGVGRIALRIWHAFEEKDPLVTAYAVVTECRYLCTCARAEMTPHTDASVSQNYGLTD